MTLLCDRCFFLDDLRKRDRIPLFSPIRLSVSKKVVLDSCFVDFLGAVFGVVVCFRDCLTIAMVGSSYLILGSRELVGVISSRHPV